MKVFSKFLALGAVIAASSSFAFADQISVNGYDSFTNTTIMFDSPYTTFGDTGIFAGLNGGTVNFVSTSLNYAAATSYPPVQIFTASNGGQSLTFFATGDTFTQAPYTTATGTAMSLTIDGSGYFTGNYFPGNLNGTFTITTQGEPFPGGDGAIVSFSATGTVPTPTSVTPEPNSLVLLGTGLAGAAGLMFMRRRQTADLF